MLALEIKNQEIKIQQCKSTQLIELVAAKLHLWFHALNNHLIYSFLLSYEKKGIGGLINLYKWDWNGKCVCFVVLYYHKSPRLFKLLNKFLSTIKSTPFSFCSIHLLDIYLFIESKISNEERNLNGIACLIMLSHSMRSHWHSVAAGRWSTILLGAFPQDLENSNLFTLEESERRRRSRQHT